MAEATGAQAGQADTPGAARGQCWAELMRRTFGVDVLACPRCGGRLRLIALIEETAAIERILRHLGLPTTIPAARPARAPPVPCGSSRRGGVGRRDLGVRPLFLMLPERQPARRRAGGVPCDRSQARTEAVPA